jgi:mannitol 2-dehydrogenase
MYLPVNKAILTQPIADVQLPPLPGSQVPPAILHMGVGNFHRSHQAYIFQKLRTLNPALYGSWAATGVCFLPSDRDLVKKMRQQDGLYHLKMSAPSGDDTACLIDSIRSILHIEDQSDYAMVLEKIADSDTKIISFTITEGGYNIDFDKYTFNFDNPLIIADLQNKHQPKTVFGVLAKGLAMRKERNAGAVTLLSCDNILKNGQALKFALMSFVEQYDQSLLEWVSSNVQFPNSMVDRITPAATENDLELFKDRYGISDTCLVVSESYFQWVIEAGTESILYPLSEVGVAFVQDVNPYEEMKLSILNGGHTLVGLLGDALGHEFINQAVGEASISNLYDRYIFKEVIPVLKAIENVNFEAYYAVVKERFANRLIRDSTARIISGSSDKIPKFILPVIEGQLKHGSDQIDIGVFVIALWWFYLNKQFTKNSMADVVDNLKEIWMDIFKDAERSALDFIAYRPVFGALASEAKFVDLYKSYIMQLQQHDVGYVIRQQLSK